MTTKLNQILAIIKGVKSETARVETDLYHQLEKKQLFAGLSRTYTPNDDEGDRLPSEQVLVQLKCEEILPQLTQSLTRLIDVTATLDSANMRARADIVLDGTVIAANVPVTTIMFLEKECEKLKAFIGRLPIVDPAQKWTYDPNRGVQVAEVVETSRTKKVPRNHELAAATDKHPAQVQVFTEDIIVGRWAKTEFSGALPADRVTAMLARLDKLRTAVKFAREEANSIEVTDVHYGEPILSFVFAADD